MRYIRSNLPPLRLLGQARRPGICRRHSSIKATPTSDRVRIVEVGPRDGLQNEATSVSVETKLELIRRLADCGLTSIEAGSFVNPKWVPQMAASSDILGRLLASPAELSAKDDISLHFLVPNSRGLDDLLAVCRHHQIGIDTGSGPNQLPAGIADLTVSIFTAATESFSRKNTNCSIAESLDRFRPVIATARNQPVPLRVRAYVSVALGCPYEGDVHPKAVADLATALLEMGADEISVGDTTGMGTVPKTNALLRTLRAAGVEPADMAMHFHDTYGQALVNTVVSLEHGIRTFDSAVGGLGGCPYSPGATGNVATESLLYLFSSLGLHSGIDLEKTAETGEWISGQVGRRHESAAGKSLLTRLRRQRNKANAATSSSL